MRTQTLWLSFAAMCLLGRSVRAEDGAAARRLLQMDFGGLLGGGMPKVTLVAAFNKVTEI